MLPIILIASLVFISPEGWKARITGDLVPERVDTQGWSLSYFKFQELVQQDNAGFWLGIEFKPGEHSIEIRRGTVAVIYLADGRSVSSTAIVAPQRIDVDPTDPKLLDNTVESFIVRLLTDDKIPPANVAWTGETKETVKVYAWFEWQFTKHEVERWELQEKE